MTKISSILTSLLTLLFILPTALQGQSIDRAAKQERARRAKMAPSERVYTNQDLEPFKAPAGVEVLAPPKSDGPEAAANAPAGSKPPAGAPASTKDANSEAVADPSKKAEEKQAPARDEAYWRQQFAEVRQKIQSLENRADVLTLRLNDLNNKFQREQDVGEREAFQVETQKALLEASETRSKLEAARRALEDLEQQARKESVPPGWIR